jgi:hypothetical protein
MSNNSYSTAINDLAAAIAANQQLIVEKNEVVLQGAPNAVVPAAWPAAVKQLYNEMNGAALQWRPVGYEDKPWVCGKVNLLPAEQAAVDGKGLVWFDHTPADSILRHFKLLDFFADEAAVGFVEGGSDELFLYLFSGEPLPLKINAEGYCQLLAAAHGFFYWQQVLVAIQQGTDNQEQQDFKTYMPQLFPGFNFDQFVNLYQNLQL